jgi:hypothetical protein
MEARNMAIKNAIVEISIFKGISQHPLSFLAPSVFISKIWAKNRPLALSQYLVKRYKGHKPKDD